jgi:hypothetical protein
MKDPDQMKYALGCKRHLGYQRLERCEATRSLHYVVLETRQGFDNFCSHRRRSFVEWSKKKNPVPVEIAKC